MVANIEWQWTRIENLSAVDWHHIVSLRQAVFVVEQDCAYLDADDLDVKSWHLIAWSVVDKARIAVAYLRVVDPGCKYQEPSIGRVLTRTTYRGIGLGKALMVKGMSLIEKQFPRRANRISAQEHLQAFYKNYGFVQVGDVYDEDGIPHIEMLSIGYM